MTSSPRDVTPMRQAKYPIMTYLHTLEIFPFGTTSELFSAYRENFRRRVFYMKILNPKLRCSNGLFFIMLFCDHT